jgi:hypothetical protein
LDVAQRATACDPKLSELAARVRTSPDEVKCRRAARALTDGPPVGEGRVRSIYTPRPAEREGPLSEAELQALDALVFPGDLQITPDLPAVPGVPPTVATLDGVALHADADGTLRIATEPGARTLSLRHAGRSGDYCVELSACATTALTAHGARLARDTRVHPGACPSR